ncbi:MAG: hypothetical protein H0X26_05755 [Alphaproteobacteria bacterium]|nr:hypothetical protein [Alphaproteobacteria bacterium]
MKKIFNTPKKIMPILYNLIIMIFFISSPTMGMEEDFNNLSSQIIQHAELLFNIEKGDEGAIFTNKKNVRSKKCLSIDSGGIGVVLPLYQLAALEAITGKRVHQLFDIIAGSGTGGVAASLLSYINKDDEVLPALEVLKMYTQCFKTLYKPISSWIPGQKMQYDSQHLKDVWAKLIEDSPFIADNFKKPTMLVLYNHASRSGWVANTHHHQQGRSSFLQENRTDVNLELNERIKKGNLSFTDMLLASSNTSGDMTPLDSLSYLASISDGTVYAPNPAFEISKTLIAGAQAHSASKNEEEFDVISFGVGNFGQKFSLNSVYTANCARVDDDMKFLQENPSPGKLTLKSYKRFQPQIEQDQKSAFDASEENINLLFKMGHEMIKIKEFKELCVELGYSTFDKNKTLDLISKSIEDLNEKILRSIMMIDFTDPRDVILHSILENYLSFSVEQQSRFVKTNFLSYADSKSQDQELFHWILNWSDKMMEVISEHNGGKSLFSKGKSSLGGVINYFITTERFIGNHAILEEKIKCLKSIARNKLNVIEGGSLETPTINDELPSYAEMYNSDILPPLQNSLYGISMTKDSFPWF